MTQELVQAPELTAAVQDYAKAIYALETRDGTATTNALAERLDVRPASVSGMLKKLAVLFLVESLGMSWDEVHAEAEVLEHVLSEGLEELIAAKLGDPTLDPHGDPIPSRELTIAYVDPGNFATNVRAGAEFGYLLVWVIVAANLMAMLIQYLSAKLGIVTDRDLSQNFREHYPRPLSWFMWVQAELISMSTDIAEFLGAALGLNLLFHVPLLPAGVMTGFIAFALLGLQRHGYRRFQLAITALLGLIFLGFLYEALKIGPSASGTVHGLVPHFAGNDLLYLAVGIIGATVMPHAIYLHSALTNRRMPAQNDAERKRVLRFERLDVIIALGLAGLINLSMLVIAAEVFHVRGLNIETIQGAHSGLSHYVGGFAALTFAVALLASGVSSSSVGTYAGQVVMAGFVNLRIPLVVRRLV